jgi:hypothetical protein
MQGICAIQTYWMAAMDYADAEILSYRAFQARRALLAWEERRRAYELERKTRALLTAKWAAPVRTTKPAPADARAQLHSG